MRVVERRFAAYLREPLSIRKAVSVIVAAIAASVVVSGLLIRLLDPQDYPNIGAGLWWALQTVTTVGYGDVVPQTIVGRLVAAVVMLESIGFVAIVTALITSSFVERARQARSAQDDRRASDPIAPLVSRLDEVAARLDRIERVLDQRR